LKSVLRYSSFEVHPHFESLQIVTDLESEQVIS
jgi:hypothetical protein